MANEHNGLLRLAENVLTPEVIKTTPVAIGEGINRVWSKERMAIDALERTVALGMDLVALIEKGKIAKEQEETKRAAIDAQLKAELKQIESTREKDKSFIEKRSVERSQLIESYNKVMDYAMKTENEELLGKAIQQLDYLTKNSILTELAE